MALIVDPDNFSKEQNYYDGIRLCKDFLVLNGITIPTFRIGTPFKHGRGMFGYYRPGLVNVNVENSRLPVRGMPVRRWTFTGWKADLTAAGIVAHEVGHHVSCRIEPELHFGDTPKEWKKFLVSGYFDNEEEVWAEMMRLFILNPDLLKQAKPWAYDYISRCELKPVVHCSWQQVLAHAHPRYHEVAENWIRKAVSL